MLEVEGFILVGGSSSRMGTDKAALTLGERNFVERIRAALAAVTERVRLVGSSASGARWPQLHTVPDVHVKWGALGGLHAALAACRDEWAAVVACDLPFVTGELFVRLAALRENFEAVVPVQADGRRQPLCALYRAAACREVAERLISQNERRPRALLNVVNTRAVPFTQLSDLDDAERFFININTPVDYATMLKEERKL